MTLEFVSRLRSSAARLHPVARVAAPLFALILLNALYILPAVLVAVPENPLLLLKPQGEILVVLGLTALSYRVRYGVWLRRLVMAVALLVWIYMWDALIGKTILHQTPLLYDQVFLIKHLGVLIGDLWSWQVGSALFGILVTATAIVWFSRRLLLSLSRTIAAAPWRRTLPIAIALSGALIAAVFVGPKRDPWVYWVTPALKRNIAASITMYEEIERGMGDSPYAHYATDIELVRKPDIQLFLVESYGRLLAADRNTRDEWKETVEEIDAELRAKGWHAVTGFSVAPVSGGRSWLAEATVLTGIYVRWEAVFRFLIEDMHKTPNLVSFLAGQGYETMLLAPKDRERRGVELENHYHYDRMICHDDLEYTGKRVGWGEIPDQYSLGYAHDNAFSKVEAPLFTNFHMVTSHAPWRVVPPIVDDWESFNRPGLRQRSLPTEQGLGEFKTRMARYRRVEPHFTYMGEVNSLKTSSYAKSIYYDLRIIARYLGEQKGRDKLVFVMGDHQPPLISADDNSYDVPLHVLANDPALLEEFRKIGFTDGLYVDPEGLPVVGHETLFSLIMRNLVACCAKPGTPLPEIDFDGVRIGSPRRW